MASINSSVLSFCCFSNSSLYRFSCSSFNISSINCSFSYFCCSSNAMSSDFFLISYIFYSFSFCLRCYSTILSSNYLFLAYISYFTLSSCLAYFCCIYASLNWYYFSLSAKNLSYSFFISYRILTCYNYRASLYFCILSLIIDDYDGASYTLEVTSLFLDLS